MKREPALNSLFLEGLADVEDINHVVRLPYCEHLRVNRVRVASGDVVLRRLCVVVAARRNLVPFLAVFVVKDYTSVEPQGRQLF